MTTPKGRYLRYISWGELMHAIEALANGLPKPSVLYGIPRNGMIIAAMLTHQSDSLSLVEPGSLPPSCVVIDDIWDTGKTLAPYNEAKYYTATLYWRVQKAKPHPTVYVHGILDDAWLVFPWEQEWPWR